MNNITGERIKEMRQLRGFSQEELGKKIGVQKAAIHKYESGIVVNLKRSVIEKLADVLDCSPVYLLGIEENTIPNAKGVKKIRLPKLGVTAAGEPIFAEYSDEYVEVDFDIKADYILDVRGDSMHPDIQDGDIVFVRSTPEAHNGQIAIVMIDGEVTAKVFYKNAHAITLMPKNAAYAPIVITDKDERNVQILGVVVRSCRNYT